MMMWTVNRMSKQNLAFSIVLTLLCSMSVAPAEANLPTVGKETVALGTKYELRSVGAFRLKQGTFGSSRFAWTVGPIAITDDDKELYVAGHNHHFSVGAFSLSEGAGIGEISQLPIASNSIPFVKVSPPLKPQGSANRITGLEVLNNQLLVMTDEYYDGNANNSEFLMIFDNRTNLDEAQQLGYFNLSARSHASGWMSKIPAPLSNELGALYLAGSASNIPINGRHSIGPSLFTWFPYFIENSKPAGRPIMMTPLIDYTLENPLHPDLRNTNRDNDIWTELSYAAYGFITPDQKHYVVLGHSGGHEGGIGYKITQENGYRCGGFCAVDFKDYYNHYWIYSIEDVKRANKNEAYPYELRPVEYGKLPLLDYRFLIIGADYNPDSNRLYLSLSGLDRTQNRFESQPVIWVFELLEQG